MYTRVRMELDIARLASCLQEKLDGMPITEEICTQMGAFLKHLKILRNSFNECLPSEDLRRDTVSRGKPNKTVFEQLFLNNSYDGSVHSLCRMIGHIYPIADGVSGRADLISGYREDPHSYVCELTLPKCDDVVALALYLDPPIVREFIVFWIGEKPETGPIREAMMADEAWLTLRPLFRRWLESQRNP